MRGFFDYAKFVAALLPAIVLAGCRTASPDAPLRAAPSIARVESYGTGFFINMSGALITNDHVIRDCDHLAVLDRGRRMPAAVIVTDRSLDLAVLRTAVAPRALATLSNAAEPVIYMPVSAAGFSNPAVWRRPEISRGFVRDTATPADLRAAGHSQIFMALMTQPPLLAGHSGGPVLDKRGLVVGVATARLQLIGNVGFAIPAQVAADLLDEIGVAYSKDKTAPTRGETDLARYAAGFTVPVLCLRV